MTGITLLLISFYINREDQEFAFNRSPFLYLLKFFACFTRKKKVRLFKADFNKFPDKINFKNHTNKNLVLTLHKIGLLTKRLLYLSFHRNSCLHLLH